MTQKGPLTRRRPDLRTLRRTTRLPRKRPARRMSTVPGVSDARVFCGFCTWAGPFFATTSYAG